MWLNYGVFLAVLGHSKVGLACQDSSWVDRSLVAMACPMSRFLFMHIFGLSEHLCFISLLVLMLETG